MCIIKNQISKFNRRRDSAENYIRNLSRFSSFGRFFEMPPNAIRGAIKNYLFILTFRMTRRCQMKKKTRTLISDTLFQHMKTIKE